MKKIFFITGNNLKFEVAKEALRNTSDIELVQKKLETPEIQSTKNEEIVSFSAAWASSQLNEPVIVSDVGYFIETLNGFPGPFIKQMNEWLSAEDFLRLMAGKENRTIIVQDCLAYCEPGKKPVLFCSSVKGKIAEQKGGQGLTPINEIFIPEGYEKTESDISREEMRAFWAKNMATYKLLAEYLRENR